MAKFCRKHTCGLQNSQYFSNETERFRCIHELISQSTFIYGVHAFHNGKKINPMNKSILTRQLTDSLLCSGFTHGMLTVLTATDVVPTELSHAASTLITIFQGTFR